VLGHSLALLADAGHNLGDVLALLVAWGASRLTQARPSARYTYGLRSTSMLAALFNAVVLLLVTGAVSAEAVRRLISPAQTQGATVMAVAAVGIGVNGVTALMFASDSMCWKATLTCAAPSSTCCPTPWWPPA
jgi:cobalt-zinc-cadmium efflux system protein